MTFWRVGCAMCLGFVQLAAVMAQPMYTIVNLGTVQTTDTASTGQGVSPSGEYITGYSSATGVSRALLWTDAMGSMGLPPLASPARNFSFPQGVNDGGVAVGFGATTAFFSSPLPVMWKNGLASQLPMPGGQTAGRAYSVNGAEVAVGSVGGGSTEFATVFTSTTATILTQTMPNGGVLKTAYALNDSGRIVGQALDPMNPAVTKGFFLDTGDLVATDLGALSGHNSAIPFAVSSNGLVAGSSSFNSGVGSLPFLWSESAGMTPVPLPMGTTQGGARGVNASGWVVGTASAATAVPFLYDGVGTYTLQSLLVNPTGWDLISGTSNGAFGIADNGVITGRGLLNGAIRGFALIPVPEPGTCTVLVAVVLLSIARRRR
ncbi:MAG TPA: hypothetical protein VIY86_03695 [Pirellulaceae bacterium]